MGTVRYGQINGMTKKRELTDIGTGKSLGILNIADYIKCTVCGGIGL